MSLLTLDGPLIWGTGSGDNPKSMIEIPGTNRVLITTGNPNWLVFDLTTRQEIYNYTFGGSQIGGPVQCFGSAASAVAMDAGGATHCYVLCFASSSVSQISTGTGIQVNGPARQQSASFDAHNVVYWASTTNASVIQFNWSTWTGSTQTVQGISNQVRITCVANMPNGNMFIGTQGGGCFEVDPVTLNVISQTMITKSPTVLLPDDNVNGYPLPTINGVEFNQNLFYVFCQTGYIFTIHWPTKKIIDKRSFAANTAQTIVAQIASGMQFHSVEASFLNGYTSVRDVSYVPSKNLDLWYSNAGSVTRDSAIQGFKHCVIFDGVTAASANTRGVVFTIQASSCPTPAAIVSSLTDGSAVQGRVMRIWDQGASSTLLNDTPVSATSETSYVPSGKNILEFATYNNGVNEKAALSMYTT